jgi:hypothetical protein
LLKNINDSSNFQLSDLNFKYLYSFPDFYDFEQILVENREIIQKTVLGKVYLALFICSNSYSITFMKNIIKYNHRVQLQDLHPSS